MKITHLLVLLVAGAIAGGCAAGIPTAPASDALPSDRPSGTPGTSVESPGRTSGISNPATSPTAVPAPSAEPSPTATVEPSSVAQPSPPATAEPTTTPIARPLPECRYADRSTRHADQDSWPMTLLDPIHRLPADYAPERLVSTTRAGLQAGYEVRPEVIDDLRAMAQASRGADAEIAVRWAYRSYGEQAGAFAYWMRQAGYERALRISARPGHSEHQLGTALDFRSADSLRAPWDYEDWGDTPAGTWMRENSWRYGFILSYPRGMSHETCYDYEPWHFRYLGRELAAAVHRSGQTLRSHLWDNFEAPDRRD